jgi:D-3-phosphoglycerate dehydrogenase
MLSRMSLGVVGYGRLGKMVARYGLCFGMKVLYYDPYVDEHDLGIQRVHSLEELVAKSDVTTVHIPHDPETETLFDQNIFSRFKRGSYFVNTSRGEIVDHTALLEALKKGTLAGAALDVFEGEFVPEFQIENHPLWKYATKEHTLLITPHIGGSTVDAWSLTEEFTILKIIEALAINTQ